MHVYNVDMVGYAMGIFVYFCNCACIMAAIIYPESQCGFRAEQGTTDMIFAAQQIQEKYREHNQDLYVVFVDLSKAFDPINWEDPWKILHTIGCPENIISVIRSFHDNMMGKVQDGESPDPFPVTNGTCQGCVLAPPLFSIVFLPC